METIDVRALLDYMWQDYLQLNPNVRKIYRLFSGCNGDEIINDHIALRTFNLDKVGIDQMARPFLNSGYEYGDEYYFSEKKLYARHYQHPDPQLPKVFISELLVDQLSEFAQTLIHGLVEQIDQSKVADYHFSCSGRHWSISYSDYCQLLGESEYAAWMSAFGYRPNHFTVSVNGLVSHQTLEEVNQFLMDCGFMMNDSGGLIKGSADVFLEQSSTLADKVKVLFSDREALIPCCYYEFARRYPLPDGNLYQGFVAKSADKIFESTDVAH